MPYIEGETLRDRIDREKQLPVDEALGIATAVANALQTAHDQGIIRRDIKPGNILLSRGEPLVADFGIALAVGAAGGDGDGSAGSLFWLTSDGDVDPVDTSWQVFFDSPALSPDGGTVAVSVVDGEQVDIWTKHLDDSPPARLTFDGPTNRRPFWHPDGVTVSFQSDRSGGNFDVWSKPGRRQRERRARAGPGADNPRSGLVS